MKPLKKLGPFFKEAIKGVHKGLRWVTYLVIDVQMMPIAIVGEAIGIIAGAPGFWVGLGSFVAIWASTLLAAIVFESLLDWRWINPINMMLWAVKDTAFYILWLLAVGVVASVVIIIVLLVWFIGPWLPRGPHSVPEKRKGGR